VGAADSHAAHQRQCEATMSVLVSGLGQHSPSRAACVCMCIRRDEPVDSTGVVEPCQRGGGM